EEGWDGRAETISSTCTFSLWITSWKRSSLRVDQRKGGTSLDGCPAPHLIVDMMGSWSATGGRSVATSEDIPSASIESLAHTRSIIFCPRVGESGGSVRVRF